MVFHEVFAGATSSLLVSPIMALLDLSILKSQLSKQTLGTSLTENIHYYTIQKKQFIRPFGIMNVVYMSTYCTANLTELACKSVNVDYKIPTLLTTSAVNIATIMYKDNEYAKLLKNSKKQFPLTSNILFAARDMSTILTCFIWKKDMIEYLDNYMLHNKSEIIASILMPCLIQIFSTPLHIVAVDVYERPTATMVDRIKHIPLVYKSVLTGRMMRAFPAFGIGGFINDMLRPVRYYEV
jgi:hypothetical protein